MSKATTKEGLLLAASEGFNKMQSMISTLSQLQQEQDFTYDTDELTAKDNALHWKRDKNLRDVFAHLYEWHQLVLNWIAANMQGISQPFLPKPYTWTTYQGMNIEFFNKHQNTSYQSSKQMLSDSHARVLELLQSFTQEELFEKKHFPWTGTSSLAQYFHSATVAHYEWAMKKIKAQKRAAACS